jgi:hypothetical protein
VESAYKCLLGRSPDPDGSAYYLSRLRVGEAKAKILYEIGTSSEARLKGTTFPGLNKLIRLQRLALLPLIGAAIRTLFRLEGNSPLEVRLRSIEQLSIFLLENFDPRLHAIERGVSELRNLVRDVETKIRKFGDESTDDSLPSLSEAAVKERIIVNQRGMNKLMGRAAEIFRTIKTFH